VQADLFVPEQAALAVFSDWSDVLEFPWERLNWRHFQAKKCSRQISWTKVEGSTKIEPQSLIISQEQEKCKIPRDKFCSFNR